MKCPRVIAVLAIAGVGLFGGFALSVPAGAQTDPDPAPKQAQPVDEGCPTGPSSSVPIPDPDCPPPPDEECPVPAILGGSSHDCPPPPDEECPDTLILGPRDPCEPPDECPRENSHRDDCPDENPCEAKTWVDASGKGHVDPNGDCPDENPCEDPRKCPPPPECEGKCKPGVEWDPRYTG